MSRAIPLQGVAMAQPHGGMTALGDCGAAGRYLALRSALYPCEGYGRAEWRPMP